MDGRREFETKAKRFARKRSIQIVRELGYGCDGTVFATSRPSAVKFLRFERLFQRELSVYERLRDHRVSEVNGFAVPELIEADTEMLAIEIGIVSPPFILDFAGAYLDEPPEYPPEVMQAWDAEKQDQFGAERWETVKILMFAFRRMGIYLVDVKPGNITFD